jgi:RNA polymerase sigma factor (sigma-70 family)
LLTGSKEAADDITQDAFIRVIGRLAHLRDPSSFGPYLRRTIVNVARMQFRRKAIERRYLEAEAANPTKVSALEREVDELRQALMQLPYRQRAAIVLRFFVDLPDNESAEILGCATGTVRSLISRGLVALRQNERIG